MDAEPTFEQARAELERALALWERGDELHRLCVAKLDAAQGRIEELSARDAPSEGRAPPEDGDAPDPAATA